MLEKDHPILKMSKEEILYQLLKKEYGYYQTILELTRQEHQRLESGCTLEELDPFLRKKRLLLGCIHEIETASTPLKRYWQQKLQRHDSMSQLIQQQLGALTLLLKDILQLDAITQRKAERHLALLKSQSSIIPPQPRNHPSSQGSDYEG